jgi:hypothetical protein
MSAAGGLSTGPRTPKDGQKPTGELEAWGLFPGDAGTVGGQPATMAGVVGAPTLKLFDFLCREDEWRAKTQQPRCQMLGNVKVCDGSLSTGIRPPVKAQAAGYSRYEEQPEGRGKAKTPWTAMAESDKTCSAAGGQRATAARQPVGRPTTAPRRRPDAAADGLPFAASGAAGPTEAKGRGHGRSRASPASRPIGRCTGGSRRRPFPLNAGAWITSPMAIAARGRSADRFGIGP